VIVFCLTAVQLRYLPAPLTVLTELDHQLGNDELLSSAWLCMQAGGADPFATAVIHQAHDAASQVNLSLIIFRPAGVKIWATALLLAGAIPVLRLQAAQLAIPASALLPNEFPATVLPPAKPQAASVRPVFLGSPDSTPSAADLSPSKAHASLISDSQIADSRPQIHPDVSLTGPGKSEAAGSGTAYAPAETVNIPTDISRPHATASLSSAIATTGSQADSTTPGSSTAGLVRASPDSARLHPAGYDGVQTSSGGIVINAALPVEYADVINAYLNP
jgi:hypothetical protein